MSRRLKPVTLLRRGANTTKWRSPSLRLPLITLSFMASWDFQCPRGQEHQQVSPDRACTHISVGWRQDTRPPAASFRTREPGCSRLAWYFARFKRYIAGRKLTHRALLRWSAFLHHNCDGGPELDQLSQLWTSWLWQRPDRFEIAHILVRDSWIRWSKNAHLLDLIFLFKNVICKMSLSRTDNTQ